MSRVLSWLRVEKDFFRRNFAAFANTWMIRAMDCAPIPDYSSQLKRRASMVV
jgi:hypothetical protein